MVTIKDIAREAGVSISTVSYALNGVDKVNERTRERIVKIAEDMNYTPNRSARNLKRKSTDVIAIYLADFGGNFYGRLLDALKISLEKYHYEMIACTGIKSHLFIPEQMVDAAVILDWNFSNKDIIKYAKMGRKIVVLDRAIDNEKVGQVLLDNVSGVEQVLERFTETPTDKVYLVSGPSNSYDNVSRLTASIKWLDKHDIDYQVLQGSFTEISGYKIGNHLSKLFDNKPMKVFSMNDEMAIGLYRYFINTDLVIGKDILISGFDNTETGQIVQPRLATVSYPIEQWSDMISKMLFEMLEGKKAEKLLLPVEFIPGESMGKMK